MQAPTAFVDIFDVMDTIGVDVGTPTYGAKVANIATIVVSAVTGNNGTGGSVITQWNKIHLWVNGTIPDHLPGVEIWVDLFDSNFSVSGVWAGRPSRQWCEVRS